MRTPDRGLKRCITNRALNSPQEFTDSISIDAYSYLNFYRCEFFIISPKIRYCSYQNIARINIVLSFSFSKLLFHSMTS